MLVVENLTKTYNTRQKSVTALNHVSIEIEQGDFLAITGRSGSGKSTLLLSLGGLIRPTSGNVKLDGNNIYSLSSNELARYRNETIGFVLQTFNLIPYLTALENVMVPMLPLTSSSNGRSERAMSLLESVDMHDRLDFLPRELSVGQQQRVAIARALANNPKIILADEPTGNLDPSLSDEIQGILRALNDRDGKTIVMVTHSPEAARTAKRRLVISDGAVVDSVKE